MRISKLIAVFVTFAEGKICRGKGVRHPLRPIGGPLISESPPAFQIELELIFYRLVK